MASRRSERGASNCVTSRFVVSNTCVASRLVVAIIVKDKKKETKRRPLTKEGYKMAKGEGEIKELLGRMYKAIDDDEEWGDVFDERSFGYICGVEDALDWVLEELSTKQFSSRTYTNLAGLGLRENVRDRG